MNNTKEKSKYIRFYVSLCFTINWKDLYNKVFTPLPIRYFQIPRFGDRENPVHYVIVALIGRGILKKNY